MKQKIEIQGLEVFARIGVPEAERSAPQRLLIDVEMEASEDFAAMGDQISRTVDYHKVAIELAESAGARPRQLIETLSSDLANWILENHPVKKVRVRVRKFILPDTEYVSASCEVSRSG